MLEKAKQFPFKKLDLNFELFKSKVKGVMSYEFLRHNL
jgi:hypothetical protein